MFRRLLVVSSFIVLLIVSTSWVRSWCAADTFSVMHSGMRLTRLRHACGVVSFSDLPGQWVFPIETTELEFDSTSTHVLYREGIEWHGVNYAEFPSFEFDYGDDRLSVSLPHWLFALIFGTVPLIQILTLIKRRRDPVCKCGYDLRGTLSAGRSACPECGVDIKPRHLAAASPV